MRLAIRAALAAALALGTGTGVLLAQDAEVPDGTPDVAGVWTGKMKGKQYGLAPAADSGKIKVPVTLEITQDGAALTAVLTTDEESPKEFFLSGFVGNGNLWLRGDASGFGTPVVLSGHVKGSPGNQKMKATGIAAFVDAAAEVKVAVKWTGPLQDP